MAEGTGSMKYVFAGDRDIAVHVLEFMMQEGYPPEALLVSDEQRATHADALIELSGLSPDKILHGKEFASDEGMKKLKQIAPHYIVGIHFPYLISREVLQIPSVGFLNLHPAYLPYNRGWHTPTWAILDGTPAGATLHFMAEELDAGDIIHQAQLKILPEDTAHSLYDRLKALEFKVFKDAFAQLLTLDPSRTSQAMHAGTAHKKRDLFQPEVQQFDRGEMYQFGTVIDKLRALTTNNAREAAYFIEEGRKYHVQVNIVPEDES